MQNKLNLYTHPLVAGLLVIMGLTLTFLIYAPGLSGGFIFDDVANITTNESLKVDTLETSQLLEATFSNYSGVLKRPISMLSFALTYYTSGFDAHAFKLFNLFLHMANGATLFLLTWLILTAYSKTHEKNLSRATIQTVSLIVCFAWLVSPINLTGVLYIVQRMASLSAFFVLWGMVLYLWGRLRLLDGKPGKLLILTSLVVGILATFSKENGALLPLYLLALELILFRFKTSRNADSRFLAVFFSVTVALPAVIAVVALIYNPGIALSGYIGRDFDFSERLMTEARILWFYIGLILFPSNARLGLFHDDIKVSSSLFEPLTTLPAIGGIIILLFAAFKLRQHAPLISLGIILFFSGHLLESTIFPLELAHEHRNYLASFGILLSVFSIPLQFSLSKSARYAAIPVAVSVLGGYSITTLLRAEYWGNPFEHYIIEARHHPDSARANTQAGVLYGQIAISQPDRRDEFYAMAKAHFMRATALRKNHNDGLYSLIDLNIESENSQNNQEVIDILTRRLATGPYMASNVNWINYFAFTGDASGPLLPLEQLNAIIQSSLINPAVRGRVSAELLSLASKYALQYGDHEAAVYLVARATEERPDDPRYRLHLVSVLIFLHRPDDARDELSIAESHDHLGAHRKEIEKYRRMLSLADS